MSRTRIIENTTKQSQPIQAPQVRQERPHKGLTPTQEEVAELAADILLNGGARTDVDLFLKALSRHQYRRVFSYSLTKDRSEQEIEEHGNDGKRWYGELARNWPEKRSAKPKEPVVNLRSVADIVRADIRGQLQRQFEEFLASMEGVENAYLLNEALEYVTGGDDDIAQAFARYIENDKTYIRIPDDMADEVRNFVALLERRSA